MDGFLKILAGLMVEVATIIDSLLLLCLILWVGMEYIWAK